jgi:hypothetical protein
MEPWSVSEAKYEDFKLSVEWLFYEVYESIPYKKYNKNKEQDYLDNIKEAFSFSNLSDFLYFWINSDYSKLTPLFTDPFSGLIKKIKGNKDSVQKIGSLALFKKGIKPMWEDMANKNGGEYSFKFNGTDPAVIVKIWETLVFSIIGCTMEEVDQVKDSAGNWCEDSGQDQCK